jgi:hypothetical protein
MTTNVASTTTKTPKTIEASCLIPGETRIRDSDGFVGTVVYVGPVASSKNLHEIYAGIEWDDPSRGKHDGSVICRRTNQIVRHFSCGPAQGSFLRLHKLDVGVSLSSSLLRNKYVEMNAPIIAPNNVLPHTARTSTGKEKVIEFLGEMKIRQQQQLGNLDKVSLRREGISRICCAEEEEGEGDGDGGLSEFQHIKDIDLAGNLLGNWTVALKILNQFPLVENFSLAHNAIRNINLNDEYTQLARFDRMTVLNLNNCRITSFETVQWVAQSMPGLESLCVANSDLSDIEQFDSFPGNVYFQKLKSLDFSNCRFNTWTSQVDKFETLPLLEQLSLDDNPISSIPIDAGSSEKFSCLQALQLSGTAVSSWMNIEGINSFPEIKSLRLKNTPLTEPLGQGEVRAVCIARFPNLQYVNASSISTKERVEAERRYVTLLTHMIHRSTNECDDGSTNKATILTENPKYGELKEKHKNLVVFSAGDGLGGKGESLANSIFNVTIKSLAPSSCTMEPIVRRVPGTLDVGRLKALCCRVFGLDYDLISLRFCSDDASQSLPVEMDQGDDKTLNYYGLCDGAKILMSEIDTTAQALELKSKKEEYEKRIADEDQNMKAMQELRSRK